MNISCHSLHQSSLDPWMQTTAFCAPNGCSTAGCGCWIKIEASDSTGGQEVPWAPARKATRDTLSLYNIILYIYMHRHWMRIGMTVFISIDMLRVWNCFNECSSAISLSQNELNTPNMSNCNVYQQSPLHKTLQDLPGSWCCFVMLCPEMRSAPQNGNWWTKWTIGFLGGTADRWHGDQVAMDSEGIICVLCADPLREVFKAAARSSVNPPSWAANSEMISTKVIKTVGGTTPVWYVLMLQKIWHKDGAKKRNMKKHKNKQFMSKQGLWMALGPWWTYIYNYMYIYIYVKIRWSPHGP